SSFLLKIREFCRVTGQRAIRIHRRVRRERREKKWLLQAHISRGVSSQAGTSSSARNRNALRLTWEKGTENRTLCDLCDLRCERLPFRDHRFEDLRTRDYPSDGLRHSELPSTRPVKRADDGNSHICARLTAPLCIFGHTCPPSPCQSRY